VHQGRVADVFGPGTYSLTSRNLPILSTIAGWPHGFDSPFKAEVYFVATRQVTDLKWGTANPVLMRDPDFGPIRIRAFGTYTLKAVEPKQLLEELVGTDSEFNSEEISELLRSIVASSFADVVASAEMAALDMASNYAELAGQVQQAVGSRVREEFGLDLPQLWIVNISFPAEVEQALDARTSMSVVGDLAAFQQYQLGSSMPVAAANPAGGLAAAGVGVGMGMAMANGMTGSPMGAGPATAGAPGATGGAGAAGMTPPPPPTEAAWHLVENGRTVGPLTAAQMGAAIAGGRVQPETLVWSAGMTGWMTAAQVPPLAAMIQSATPPPPPPNA
jgi:membrane protease subunit (stomatin/prohibitin family)